MNIKSQKTNFAPTWPCLALLCALLAACASPPVYVPAQPRAEPKPVATADMMQTLPEPSHFRQRLMRTFKIPPTKPTE